MSTYKIKLIRHELAAEGTMAFHFEKPGGFQFTAGQYGDFTLIHPAESDAEGDVRSFSIASAPSEADLMIATRMRDTAFKRVLSAMPPGAEISMEGPSGTLTLHAETSRPAVFLAGGIGVTPFRSIILEASEKKLAHRLLFFYSNRRPEDAAFLEELQGVEKRNERFTLIATMTEMKKSRQKWPGKTGYVDKQMLSESIEDLKKPIYYLAGPPAMISAMGKLLADLGIGKESIQSEEFAGY